MKKIHLILLAAVLYIFGWSISWAQTAGQGAVESANLEEAGRVLVLRGWVATERSNTFAVQAQVQLGEQQVYQGRLGIGGGLRPDVVAATGKAHWLNSGFEIRLRMPQDLPTGDYPVAMRVRTSDGQVIVLQVLEPAATVQWQETQLRPSVAAYVLLGMALGLPLLVCGWRWAGERRQVLVFALAVVLSFACLVAGGWSGSSLALLWEGDTLVEQDGHLGWGQAQPVRTDEWLVITAMALGQSLQPLAKAGQERFPNTNTLLTAEGQNMNVVGMTGVPVANWAAWAKPATWGFFVLDTRRALAWYWWLPFFGCFFALWWALSALLAVPWRWSAALAGLVSAAPLSVGWSGWPAYVLGFAVLSWAAWLKGWQAKNIGGAGGWGILAGWAAAGAVLTLYPAWLLVLASLLLPLAGAWLYEQRGTWRWCQGLGVTLGLCVGAGLLLGNWWLHAQEAVAAIQATVYPGRRLEVGGYLDAWFLAKGLLAPIFFFHASEAVGPSDGAAFICVLLPLGVWLLWRQYQSRCWDVLANVCLFFVLWVAYFSFIGVPTWLAKATGWSMVPVYRVDIGWLLAQTFLWALAIRHILKERNAGVQLAVPWAMAATAWMVVLAGLALWYVPVSAAQWAEPSLWILALAGVAALCWWVLRGQHMQGLVLYGAWMLAATIPFNPLNQAPAHVRISSALEKILSEKKKGAEMPRVAVLAGAGQALSLGGHRQTLALQAAGMPVASGALYHPPLSFWKTLDAAEEYSAVYNRYQHLLLEHKNLSPEQEFSLMLPRLDVVLLQIDARRFDFSKMGVQYVLIPENSAEPLRENPKLQEKPGTGGWAVFDLI